MKVSLIEAKELLEAGKIVCVPTDTVYGLAINPLNIEAMEALYALKKRDKSKPFLFLAGRVEDLPLLIKKPEEKLWKELCSFWPGALTVVCEASSLWQEKGFSSLGVRVPQHPTLLALLKKTGPLMVTSANLSGEKPASSAKEVQNVFPELAFVEGGIASGLPSTILSLKGKEASILREGSVTKQALEKFYSLLN